jgi:hypothetical protein
MRIRRSVCTLHEKVGQASDPYLQLQTPSRNKRAGNSSIFGLRQAWREGELATSVLLPVKDKSGNQ